ncbi:MAG: phosphate ABC transporter substrate-binding protein [Coriobacteriia bacterium]|nr:phosphate ABC transporter substrate-binding protein [Coriobacteriia bacterium]
MLSRRAFAAAGVAVVMSGMLALAGCGGSTPAANNTNGGGAAELSGTVSTNGSTSMERVIGSLSEAFMQENTKVTITYDATGSGTGIECAGNGSADIGLSSRDLKSTETGLTSTTVALDGIAVVVNSGNGVANLTLQQVTDIFTGKITNWKEVGGEDLEIACIGRESGSGTRDGFESVTQTTDACKLAQELTSTGAVLTAVANSKNAIGYASVSSVSSQSGVKAVTIDGVECTEANIQNGKYAIQRPFNLITKEGKELSTQAQAFIEFCTSSAASDIIRKAGAVPVK